MDVSRICSLLNGRLVVPGKNCDIVGFYAGDFLSHVLLKAQSGYALLTVINHLNVAAVAVKVGLGAVILCDGVEPTDKLVYACEQSGITLITTSLDTFRCAAAIGKNDFNAQ